MQNSSDPMRLLRLLRGDGKGRSLLLATVTEDTHLWRQASSLTAYHVIVSALDSSDDEVRRLAEESLSRSSPRPANHKADSVGPTLETVPGGRSQHDDRPKEDVCCPDVPCAPTALLRSIPT